MNMASDGTNLASQEVICMANLDSALIGVVAALVQLLVGLGLAMGSVFIGLKMYDRLTEGVDDGRRIKKGNGAVGDRDGGGIFAIANLVQSGVVQITSGLSANQDVGTMVTVLIIGFIDLAIGLVAAVVSVWIAIKVLDRIATDIEEMEDWRRATSRWQHGLAFWSRYRSSSARRSPAYPMP